MEVCYDQTQTRGLLVYHCKSKKIFDKLIAWAPRIYKEIESETMTIKFWCSPDWLEITLDECGVPWREIKEYFGK